MTESGPAIGNDNELRLRAEIEALQRKLDERERQLGHAAHGKPHKPTAKLLWTILFVAAAVVGVAFFSGYQKQAERQSAVMAAAKDESDDIPIVNVTKAVAGSDKSELVLPGNIQALTEAPILARATGYVKQRYVDIGDRVREGQLLAEIDAPELEHQVNQAKAALEQASASQEQANAALEQGKANEELARTTAERYQTLVARGAVSKQENDTWQAQSNAQHANVLALGKAVNAAKSNVSAATANLARLSEVQSHIRVRAPFAGVITVRNVDVGALVNEGSTLLYRIAQTGRVRTYVNVPQAESTSLRVGLPAVITIPDLPATKFPGTVTRTSNSLDLSSRTLLAEVQVDNTSGALLPGMYALVKFATPRQQPPVVIKGDTLVMRADGPQVAVVDSDNVLHYHKITLGRDFGDRIEALTGIEAGDLLVINPGDRVQDGVKVKTVLADAAPAGRGGGPGAAQKKGTEEKAPNAAPKAETGK